MTKWEYMLDEVELANSRNGLIEVLNRHGRNGWELTACIPLPTSRLCFFKRPIPEAPQGLFVYHDPTPQTRDEDDDSNGWDGTWRKLDEYMRDRD